MLHAPGRGSERVGEGFSDQAHLRCSGGRRTGSGRPPAQHKSIAGGCLFPGARVIESGQEPESHDAGMSRFAGNGSHLAGEGAAEDHAGQVDGPGSSEFTKNGSHLAAANFSNEPGAVLWRHTPPHRTESGRLSYGTASPDSSVQKTALWRTRAHLGAGAARGGGSNAGRRAERAAGASGSWWRIVLAPLRWKPMRARWLKAQMRRKRLRGYVGSPIRASPRFRRCYRSEWRRIAP